MAEDREADSPDESASAARPDGEDIEQSDDVEAGAEQGDQADSTDSSDSTDDELVEEHVAPDDAREPSVEELEQLLEGDDDSDQAGQTSDSDDDSGDDPDDDSDDDSGEDSDGDAELVSVGAASKTSSNAADGKSGSTAAVDSTAKKGRSKKDKATPKQKKAVEKRQRTTPVSFVKEAVGELRKVVYPTAPQLGNYFVVVLVFVLIIIGFVSVLDLGFGWLIVKVFGK